MKRSGKLLFWNKNNIETCSRTSINRKLTPYVVRIKRGQYRKRRGKLLFWNKNNIKTCSNTLIDRKLTDYVVRIERSVGRGEANYYFGIKITLKLAQMHQSIGNSQAMLLDLKDVSI